MRTLTTIIIAGMLAIPALADERLEITPTTTGDEIVRYHLDTVVLSSPVGGGASITLQALGVRADGECARVLGQCVSVVARYEGEQAVSLLNTLNTMDFSTVSLRRRIFNKMQADGYLPVGSYTGNPGVPTFTPTPEPTATPVE